VSDQDLTFGVTIERVDAALRDIGRVEQANASAARGTQQAAQTMGRSAQAASSSISSLGQAATQAGQAIGRGIGALGQMTTALGSLAPAGSAAGAAVSQLGGTVGALSGAMGPLGLALAGVTAAVGLMGAGFRAQQSAMDASADSARALTASYEDLAAAAQRAATAQENQARLERGGGTAAEQRGFTQAAQNRQELALRALSGDVAAQAELRRAGLISSGGEASMFDRAGALLSDLTSGQAAGTTRVSGVLDPADTRRLEELSRRAGETALQRQALEGEAISRGGSREASVTPQPRRGGGGRASTPLENTTDNGAAIARYAAEQELELVKAYEERARAEAELEAAATARAEAEREKNEIQKEAERERLAALRELEQAAIESSDTFRDSWRGSIDDVVDSWREANRAIRASNGQMMGSAALLEMSMRSAGNSIADTIGGTMVNAFESALGAWLDGSKSFVEAAEDMVKGVLKALVIESIVQAVTETARGIADLASYKYDTAGLHFAAAAAWAAVGGVAGAVGAGIGAFGGGGDKGGASAGAATVTPTDASSSQGQQQPTVINVYPGGYITRRDVEDGIVDALNSAAREGRRLDPALVGV